MRTPSPPLSGHSHTRIRDNFSDPQTKYLVGKVWMRHLHYTHNISGEPPPVAVKNKKKIVTIDESQKE